MNQITTDITTRLNAQPIRWAEHAHDGLYRVACTKHGCLSEGGDHILEWGDILTHTAFEVHEAELDLRVVAFDTEDGAVGWLINGGITDDEHPLSAERVARFTAFYNSATALVAELTSDEVPC